MRSTQRALLALSGGAFLLTVASVGYASGSAEPEPIFVRVPGSHHG